MRAEELQRPITDLRVHDPVCVSPTTSVREVIAKSGAITNLPVPVVEKPRRPGDAAMLVSGSARAIEELGWSPKRSDLATMISDAWRWHQSGHYKK